MMILQAAFTRAITREFPFFCLDNHEDTKSSKLEEERKGSSLSAFLLLSFFVSFVSSWLKDFVLVLARFT